MSDQAKCGLCGEPMPPGEQPLAKAEESHVFHAEAGVRFERHDETGDVTIHTPGGSVRVPSNTWVSAVAEMTCHGGQVNHAAFKIMHTGIGTEV